MNIKKSAGILGKHVTICLPARFTRYSVWKQDNNNNCNNIITITITTTTTTAIITMTTTIMALSKNFIHNLEK